MPELVKHLSACQDQDRSRAKEVIAVEFDEDLADKLPGQFPGTSLKVITGDILSFSLDDLPVGYKVVANVPYYITSKIIQKLCESSNPPSVAVLLVQKEVAERIAAMPGKMSILAVAAQLYADASLGPLVVAEYFTPPPKVDSQVVVLKTHSTKRFSDIDDKQYFRMVKAGFSAKRKKLHSSLAGGLGIDKPIADSLLRSAGVNPDDRAEALTLDRWAELTRQFAKLDA